MFIWLRPKTPYPPPTHCIVFTCIQYTYSHKKGGRDRELNQREVGERQQGRIQITKLGWNTNTIGCTQETGNSSLFTLINTCRNVPLPLFLDDDILHWFLWVLSFYALAAPSNIAICMQYSMYSDEEGLAMTSYGSSCNFNRCPACDHQGTLLDNDSVEFVLTCTLNSIENPCCHPAYWTMDLRRG
jgi:hypothetical protein